jgi:hypothetical protein
LVSDKSLEQVSKYLIISTLVIAIVKLILSTLTTQDVLCILAILTVSQAARVLDYKYPKRPDLFSEVESLHKKISDIESKYDVLENDMTGVKFGLKTRS